MKWTVIKIIMGSLCAGVLLGFAVSCSTIRTDIVKPTLVEELAWNKMLKDWSVKAYASRDFRAGFLLAATKPFQGQLPGSLNLVVQDIAKLGSPEAEDYKAGAFGGATLAMYCIAQGEGVKWLFAQLTNLGMIPANILSGLVGL